MAALQWGCVYVYINAFSLHKFYMPKLLTAVLALLAVLAVAAMVQAKSLVSPPLPSNTIDEVEKVRDSEREVWDRFEKSKSNWQDLASERFRRIVPEPPLPPSPPIRPPPIEPLR